MKHLPWKLLSAAALLGLAFDILFFDIHQVGINVLLMQALFLGVTFGLAKWQKRKIELQTWLAAIYATVFSLIFAIWTNEISLTMAGLGLFIANSYFLITLFGHHGKFHHPLHILRDGATKVLAPIAGRLNILTRLRFPGKGKSNTEVTRGIIIALPILAIFAALFLGSDLVLQHQTSSFFDNLNEWLDDGQWRGHIALFFFTTLAFLGMYSTMFWRKLAHAQLPELKKHFQTESVIILGGSVLLFLGFILFQSVYLFGGQAAWDKIDGITYAEYAVQGFNELSVIAALVILLILTFRYFHTEHVSKWVKGLEVALIVETILVIISAWIRMSLYTEQYGFTDARLFGFWFFVVAAVLLGLLGHHILKKRQVYTYIHHALLFAGVAIFAFACLTPDALSVRLNLARVTDDAPYDTAHLRHISAEGYNAGSLAISGDYPISGLITEEPIYDIHCAYILSNSNSRGDEFFGGYGAESILPGFQGNDIYWDLEVRERINDWEHRWMNVAYHSESELGTSNSQYAEWEYTYFFEWQAWNLSRAQLPANINYDPNVFQSWQTEFKQECRSNQPSTDKS
jgi:hypothetical protein